MLRNVSSDELRVLWYLTGPGSTFRIRHERDLGSQAIEAKDWKEHLDKYERFIEWSYKSQKSEVS